MGSRGLDGMLRRQSRYSRLTSRKGCDAGSLKRDTATELTRRPSVALSRLRVENCGELNTWLRGCHERIVQGDPAMSQVVAAIRQQPALEEEWVNALAAEQGVDDGDPGSGTTSCSTVACRRGGIDIPLSTEY